MHLLDKYLPAYQYTEIHTILVNGTLEECYKTTLQLDLAESKIIKILFKLRGLPFSNTRLAQFTHDMKFTLLEEKPFTEFIYGFWVTSKVEWIEDKLAFIETDKGYNVKSVWGFSFEKIDANHTVIITETRVKCITPKAKFIFSVYWFFIKPFSGLIRMQMLRLIKQNVSNGIK